MNRFGLIILFFFFYIHSVYTQNEVNDTNLVYQSTMLGVGGISIYDTYLSPLEYQGTNFGLIHEQTKMTGMLKQKVSAQHLFCLDFAKASNATETASDFSGFVSYSYGLHYRFKPAKNFQIFTGGQINGLLGIIYSDRNGNNPFAAKAHLNLNLSLIAAYRFQIKKQPFKIRYQVDMPCAGLMFSPHYGQSYYEISLGDNDDIFHLSSFGNQVTMKNMLSLEIPFNTYTLRLSYINNLYQTDVNSIETKIHSDSFFIGFSRDFFSVSGKSKNKTLNRVFD